MGREPVGDVTFGILRMTHECGLRCLGSPGLLLESLDEPPQQLGPDLILADLILDPVFEIGIVIDFHDDEAGVGLLYVDPIESVTDRTCGAYGDIDQFGWRLIDLEGFKAALA